MASGTVDGRPQSDDVNFASTRQCTRDRAACSRCPACTDPNQNAVVGVRQPADRLAARQPQLPGPPRPRPVLRLGPREHGPRGRRPRRRRDAAARGRDHRAGLVRADRPRARLARRARADRRARRLPTRAACWSRRGRRRTTRDDDRRRRLPAGAVGPLRRHDRAHAPTSTASSRRSTWPRSRRASRRTPATSASASRASAPSRPRTAGPNTEPYGFTIKVVAAQGRRREGADRRGPPQPVPAPRPGHDRRLPEEADERRRRVAAVRRPGRRQPQRARARLLGRLRARLQARRLGAATAGPCAATGPRCTWAGAHSRPAAVSDDVGGAILPSTAAADLDRDGAPEVVAADLEGKLYVWNAEGERVLDARGRRSSGRASRSRRSPTFATTPPPTRASAAAPSTASSDRRCWPTSTGTTTGGSRS